MRSKKTLFVFFIVLIGASHTSYSQIRKSVKSSGYRQPTVSRNKAKIMCPIFEQSQYPYQGIGFKLGDPFALSYKFYPNKHWSFAADAGKAASGLYNKYYRNEFTNAYLPDSLESHERFQYLSHKVKSDWFLEAKFLYQWDASKISKGLQLYAGLGWQWRSTSLEYSYLYEEDNFGESRLSSFTENRFTYGPVGVLGFEYSYFSLPLSAFIEIEWFTDVLLNPGYQRFQGGVGLRYVF